MPVSVHQRGTPDWLGLLQAAGILVISAGIWLQYKSHQADELEWKRVTEWLKLQDFQKYEQLLYSSGIDTLVEVAGLDVDHIPAFATLSQHERVTLQTAVNQYHDQGILEQWLTDCKLQTLFKKLTAVGIHSLEALLILDTGQLHATLTRSRLSAETVDNLDLRIRELRGLQQEQSSMKGRLTERFLKTLTVHRWSIGGLFTFLLVAGMLLFIINMNYTRCVTHAGHKHSILEFVTGKYLAIQFCKVTWDWTEPHTVGKTMTFRIRFYQRNGRPYPVSVKDKLLVEVMQGTTQVPPTVQLGGPDPADMCTAKVTFTVHRAGEYRIAVMVGAKHIRGSPFTKSFQAGPLDPSQTSFVNQSSVVVCTMGINQQLVLEPRDEYSNICSYSPSADHSNSYAINVIDTTSGYTWMPKLRVVYEQVTKRIVLNLVLDREGCYLATATYQGVKLKNGEFTILVLSESASNIVAKNVAKKSTSVYYESHLLACNYDRQAKAKKVFCYISPKQLTIKEFYLKIIPKRLFTFRVCPSTKFQFRGIHNQYNAPVLVIEDGCQAPVELAAKDRNIIAATFTNFLLKNIGGSENFKDKQDFFNHEIRQLHSKRPHDKLSIKISRHMLLESSIKATRNFSTADWCKNFELIFQGEEALDWGGVRREWFEVLSYELFDPAGSGLFERFKDDTQALVHPNPSRKSYLKLKYYEFAGKIIGKCLYESSLGGSYRQLVKARFTRSFLAQLIGLRVNYKYFEQDDTELYVSKIRYIEENDVDGMDLVFAEEEYVDGKLDKVIELIPGGSRMAVTNRNKLRYLDLLAQRRLSSRTRDEIESFLKGLNELIPDNLLSIFDENELELLMCGTGDYSIAQFKEHHIVCGASPEFSKVLEWFWALVSGFTREDMARLLQFTTGCSQLPLGGFAELCPKFQITAAPTYGTLPTAHTCFNQLCLPDYDSLEQFSGALQMALVEGNQGFGMI